MSRSDIVSSSQSLPDVIDLFNSTIQAESLKNNLDILAKDPHTGGTYEDEVVLVGFIEKLMQEAGMEVKIPEYDVLLSYPQREDGKRNFVAIVDAQGKIIEETKSAEVEEILADSQNNSLVFNPFM